MGTACNPLKKICPFAWESGLAPSAPAFMRMSPDCHPLPVASTFVPFVGNPRKVNLTSEKSSDEFDHWPHSRLISSEKQVYLSKKICQMGVYSFFCEFAPIFPSLALRFLLESTLLFCQFLSRCQSLLVIFYITRKKRNSEDRDASRGPLNFISFCWRSQLRLFSFAGRNILSSFLQWHRTGPAKQRCSGWP